MAGKNTIGRGSGDPGQIRKAFPKIELVTIAEFGGWTKTQATHFADGGVFDKIYAR